MIDAGKYRGPYSLSMLFDLSTQKLVFGSRYNSLVMTVEDEISFKERCGPYESYDPFNRNCKHLSDTNCENCTKRQRKPKNYSIGKQCSYVKFNVNDFELKNSTILKHLATGKLYDNFILLNNSVSICLTEKPYVRLKKLVQLDDIFHLSTNGVSMLSLLATIFIYVRTSLHKLPSKCLICLSLCLLVAQSMLLIGPVAEGNVVCCKMASLVMHYSFMTSFTWMNVIAYDIYYSFTRHFQNSAYRSGKWFLKYSLFAWLFPFILVTTAFITDEISSWDYSPKYSDPTCWINNQNGLWLFFLSPLAVIMLSNMFFFAMSFVNICISYRAKTEEIPKKKPSQLLIYIKLSVVMGLTWVFGVLGNVVRNDIFWTLFVISNGLQGLFIFLGFALKPLIKMVQDKTSKTHDKVKT